MHRRGIVDAQYLARTPDSFARGEPLIVSASDLRNYFAEVRDVGLEIAQCADGLLSKP